MNNFNNFSFLNKINKKEKLYAVPDGYFEAFSDVALTRVRLNSAKNIEMLSVPLNYFSNFSDRVLEKIKKDNLPYEESNTPILDGISKENVYTVPADYFSSLSKQIVSIVDSNIEKQEAKVIPLRSRRKSWTMAVAAAVISAIVLGASFIWEHGNQPKMQHTDYAGLIQQKSLSQLRNEAIAEYLSLPDGSIDVDTMAQKLPTEHAELNNIPQEQVEHYLENTPAVY